MVLSTLASNLPTYRMVSSLIFIALRALVGSPSKQSATPQQPDHPDAAWVSGEGVSVGPRDWETSHKTAAIFTTRACALLFQRLAPPCWVPRKRTGSPVTQPVQNGKYSGLKCGVLPLVSRLLNSTGEVGADTDRAGSRSFSVLRSAPWVQHHILLTKLFAAALASSDRQRRDRTASSTPASVRIG